MYYLQYKREGWKDWVGCRDSVFPLKTKRQDLENYLKLARSRQSDAIYRFVNKIKIEYTREIIID